MHRVWAQPVRPRVGLPSRPSISARTPETRPSARGATAIRHGAAAVRGNPSVRAWGYPIWARGNCINLEPVRPRVGLPRTGRRSPSAPATRPSARGATRQDAVPLRLGHNPSVRAWGYPMQPAGRIRSAKPVRPRVGLPMPGKCGCGRFSTRPSARGATISNSGVSARLSNPSVRAWGYPISIGHRQIIIKPVRPRVGLPTPRRQSRRG